MTALTDAVVFPKDRQNRHIGKWGKATKRAGLEDE
jgi:hypothetical protein